MEFEAELVARLQGGDEGALAELYERLGGNVYALALKLLKSREEAEEVVQDTFLTLYRKAESYKTPHHSPRAFIYTIARNEALSRLRKRGARPSKADGLDVHDPTTVFSAPAPADPTTPLFVDKMLEQLDGEERKLLEGSFYSGYTHAELAELTDLPLGTVKSKLRRALLKLRDYAEAL